MTAPAPALNDLSLEHQVALLPLEEQEAILAEMDLDELVYDWGWSSRPSQRLPMRPDEPGYDWSLAVLLAGRGFGKTLTGAQWIRTLDAEWKTLGRDAGHMRFFMLGRTAGDVRDVMLEGPSGLLSIYPPSERNRVQWIPSRRRVELPNGSVGLCFSSEEPDQLRGPACHVGWADELAAHKQVRLAEGEASAWENLRIAAREGDLPQVLATTTPKRVPVVREILKERAEKPDKVLLRRGRTFDNPHLHQVYKDTLISLYGGTALGRQELEGEVLDTVRGAMTDEPIINRNRLTALPGGIPWIRVIGVDPSVAERPHDECGIVVVYISRTWPVLKRHAFVVDDLSDRMSPTKWSQVVLDAAEQHDATVVVETNQGGNVVSQLLRQTAAAKNRPVPQIRETWSSKAKQVRSEPVGAAYARGRIHHINVLADLESQITSWVQGEAGYSPDRMDALVHACASGLFPESLINGGVGGAAIRTAADQRLEIGWNRSRVG